MHKRDFSINQRLVLLSVFALVIGAISTVGAWFLLAAIRFFTNLFFYQTFSLADHSPADHQLGAWVIVVPAIGGLIVGLMCRYGSEKIRGHGIPEALEAILYGKSRMSPKIAVLKPLSSGIVIGSGGAVRRGRADHHDGWRLPRRCSRRLFISRRRSARRCSSRAPAPA